MECIEYSELISAYVDEMLSPQEEELLMAHLKVCEKCSQELEVMKEIKKMCGEIKETELPQGFHQDLMDKINKEKQVKQPISLKWRWQYGGAMVAAAMIGFFALNRVGVFPIGNNMHGEGAAETAPYTAISSGRDSGQNLAKSYLVEEAETDPNSVSDDAEAQSRAVQTEEEAVSWQISTHDMDAFMGELKEYLDKKEIPFEAIDQQIICYEVEEADQLKEWLQNHGADFTGEVPNKVSDIEINLILEK